MRLLVGRPLTAAIAVCLLVVAVPAAGRNGPGEGLTFSAAAGVAGHARAGRWLPVRIAIENTGRDLDGDLLVEAGTARAVRAIALPAPSSKQVEMHVRMPWADVDRVRVRLVSGGVSRAEIDVPIQLVPEDRGLSLCAGTPADPTDSRACDAAIAPDEVPRSWRGLDAADGFTWPRGGELARLDEEQRLAVERFARLRANDAFVAPVVRPPDAPAAPLRGPLLAGYSVLLVAIALGSARVARRAWRAYAALAAAVVLGVAVTLAEGRIGPGAAFHVLDAAVVRTGEGWPGSLVSVRGAVHAPAFGPVELRASAEDLALELRGAPAEASALQLEDGTWALTGTLRKGERVAFEAEGFIGEGYLDVARDAGRIRVTNRSAMPLTDCTAPAGLSPRMFAQLNAGATIELRGVPQYQPAEFTCGIAGVQPWLLSDSRVDHRGTAVLSFTLRQ